MAAAVLDSHALLAFFRGEEGAALVKDLLHKAATADRPLQMTEVNYAEVKYTLLKKDGPSEWERAADILTSLPIEFHPATAWPTPLPPRWRRKKKPTSSPATRNSSHWQRK